MTVCDDLLIADFNECFEQMRHYDEAFLKRLEFGFGGVVTIVGAAAFLIEHFQASAFSLAVCGLLLSVSGVAGILLVSSLARNRVYFAFVARYVNEIRALYVSKHPEGFANKTGMYTDHTLPKIFDPGSSQSIDVYVLAICVSLLVSGAVTSFEVANRVLHGEAVRIFWTMSIGTFLFSAAIQLALVVLYWHHAQAKETAHGALHGKVESESSAKPK